jgi:hypothetical protein
VDQEEAVAEEEEEVVAEVVAEVAQAQELAPVQEEEDPNS